MNERYKVGFENGVSCFWLDDNLGRVAIVDTQSHFSDGECIALADNEEIARKIVLGLNFIEQMKEKIPKIGE